MGHSGSVGEGVRESIGESWGSKKNLSISFSFPLVQTVDVCVSTGVVVSVSVGNGRSEPQGVVVPCGVWVVSGIKG